MRWARALSGFIFLFSLVTTCTAQSSAKTVAFTHVTVIDATGAAAKPDQTVVVIGNRIAQIGPFKSVTLPKDAQVVDGKGKFLIPGLWDMHVHVAGISAEPSWGHFLLPVYLAHGITGVRDMAGDLETLRDWKRAQSEGSVLAPRMAVCGPFLDASEEGFTHKADVIAVRTAEEAKKAVEELVLKGADFIKIGDRISPEVFSAIAEESKRQHVPFLGHLPRAIGIADASDAGMKSMEHLYGFDVAMSGRATELQVIRKAAMAKGDAAAVNKASADAETSFDQKTADALFNKLKKNHTWIVPTLAWTDITAHLDKVEASPYLKYLPAKLQEEWAPEKARKLMSARGLAFYQHKLERDRRTVSLLAKAGVPMLAGSDSLDPYVFPGDSLHKELALLVENGLTPMQALQTATLNPARFFGTEAQIGTVEKGKLADLVLLNADPLADIHNTRKIAGVMLDGKYLPKAELEELLAKSAGAMTGTK